MSQKRSLYPNNRRGDDGEGFLEKYGLLIFMIIIFFFIFYVLISCQQDVAMMHTIHGGI